jgi:hypothetical protein
MRFSGNSSSTAAASGRDADQATIWILVLRLLSAAA